MSVQSEKRVEPVIGEGPVTSERTAPGNAVVTTGCDWDDLLDPNTEFPFDTSSVVVQPEDTSDEGEEDEES